MDGFVGKSRPELLAKPRSFIAESTKIFWQRRWSRLLWLHHKTQPLATLPTNPIIKREKFYKKNQWAYYKEISHWENKWPQQKPVELPLPKEIKKNANINFGGLAGEYSFKLDPQELMENFTIREQPVNFLVGIEATYLVLWGPIEHLTNQWKFRGQQVILKYINGPLNGLQT